MWGTCEDRNWNPSRRQALAAGSSALLALLGAPSALSQVAFGDKKSGHPLMVVVFLRGGVDGLNTVVPYREDDYYKQRPTLHVPSPRSSDSDKALDLDGFFGLNPLLAPILPAYREGQMAILHAVGSNDATRSHFQAMAAMEKGISYEGERTTNGWLARYLAMTAGPSDSPLRALAFSDVLPESLSGATSAIALNDLSSFQLQVRSEAQKPFEDERAQRLKDAQLARRGSLEAAFKTMYSSPDSGFGSSGTGVLETIAELRKLDPKSYKPEPGVEYPANGIGQGLKQVALLAKNNVGLEVACVDMGGWDSHFGQAALLGLLMDDLGPSLGAFTKDMAPLWSNTVLVVMTEFGRRVNENSTLGTDHGRSSIMFVAGGGVKGGRVVSRWPGLAPSRLDEVGDLKVGIDYREPLSEVVRRLRPEVNLGELFPGHAGQSLGLF